MCCVLLVFVVRVCFEMSASTPPYTHTRTQGTAGAATTADQLLQLRPKRALYGSDRRLRAYDPLDAHAQALLAKATGYTRGASIGNSSKDGGLALSRSTVQQQQEDVYADYAELGRQGGIVLISTGRILVVNEEGETREILRLADILFAEAVEAGQKPGIDRVRWGFELCACATLHDKSCLDFPADLWFLPCAFC